MNFLTVDGVIGAVFVLVYAYERFNTPKTNRSMTTWWRFWTFSIIYYISVVFIYVLLAKSTILLQVLASTRVNALADFGAGVDVKQIIDSLSPELVAALFLTILLRRLDFLAKPDDWLRTLFQTMAAIPHAARHIGAEIRRATFSETEDVVNRLRPLTRRMRRRRRRAALAAPRRRVGCHPRLALPGVPQSAGRTAYRGAVLSRCRCCRRRQGTPLSGRPLNPSTRNRPSAYVTWHRELCWALWNARLGLDSPATRNATGHHVEHTVAGEHYCTERWG